MLSLRNSGLTDHSFGRLALAIQLSEAKPTVIMYFTVFNIVNLEIFT